MALTPRIEIRQKQNLVMTPQLQVAIRLLGMSGSDLAAHVAEEVEKNPLLKTQESPDLPALPFSSSGANPQGDFLQFVPEEVTLWSHLRQQIRALRIREDTTEIACIIADELDEDGYLRVKFDELQQRHRLSVNEILRGLSVVQSCDPSGTGARNLRECLALQLRELDRLDPAMQALLDNLHLATNGPTEQLQALCGVNSEDIADMIVEIRALNPKPGLKFGFPPIQAATPDMFVHKEAGSGKLRLELNTAVLPRVLVNNVYETDLGDLDSDTRQFISECRSSANWLVKALEQRARTILKIAGEIATRQERFFSEGPSALKPLTRREIAEKVKMHESTVGRATSGKFLSCQQGNFELRFFFRSSIQSNSGGAAHSSAAVQVRIQSLISAEEPGQILSDEKVVSILQEEGIDIARRTVAKYRRVMGIPASVDRRRRKVANTEA